MSYENGSLSTSVMESSTIEFVALTKENFTPPTCSPTPAKQSGNEQKSNWEKVRQEVTCAICLELLDDPKSMPCLHTYCKKCLMEALAKRPHDPDLPRDRPAINCPLCRAEVDLSDQGIEALPSNFSASRLVETVQLQDKLDNNKAPKCDGCKENDAIASCCECGGIFLCSICYKSHQNLPMTSGHCLLLLNEVTQSKPPVSISKKSPLCQKHPQELLKLYCQECELLVCRDCVLVTHRLHNYNFVDTIADKEKTQLKDVTLCEIEETLGSTVQAITSVKKMQQQIDSKKQESVSKLNEVFEDIAAIMQCRKDAILREIQQISDADFIPLQKQEENLTTLKERLESCRNFTKDTLLNGTNSEIMSSRKQMLERSKHLQEVHKSLPLTPVRKPTIVESYQLEKIKKDIEKVGVFIDTLGSCVQSVEKQKDSKVVTTILVKGTKGQQLSGVASSIAVCAEPNNSIAAVIEQVSQGKYTVSLSTKQPGKYLVYISVGGMNISGSPFVVQFVEEKNTQVCIQEDDNDDDEFNLFDDAHTHLEDDVDDHQMNAYVQDDQLVNIWPKVGKHHHVKTKKKRRL